MTNLQIRDALLAGNTVSVRLHGNSMSPKVNSGDLVTIEPVRDRIRKGDVVFCKVNGHFYLHLVKAVRGLPSGQREGHAYSYQIANNHGHVNGWTIGRNIFGKLVSVLP